MTIICLPIPLKINKQINKIGSINEWYAKYIRTKLLKRFFPDKILANEVKFCFTQNKLSSKARSWNGTASSFNEILMNSFK